MKLRAIHLFIILIGSLILCSLFCSYFPIREGMKHSSKSTGDVALEVQKAGEKQAKSDYNEYQAMLANDEDLPSWSRDPNSNYPPSNKNKHGHHHHHHNKKKKNIGGDPNTWTPATIGESSGGVIDDIEKTMDDAGKEVSDLFSGDTSPVYPDSKTGTSTKNGYTTTTSNVSKAPLYSFTAPAGDTVDVYNDPKNIPWYDNGSSSGGSSSSGSSTNTNYYPDSGSSINTYVGPRGNRATVVNPPQGIPQSHIPAGDEDLYILKSQVVPPVCPACPSQASCPRQEPCQPCPPCARCPEPSFECKKVPNYSSANDQYLPRPVLNDFSSFGM